MQDLPNGGGGADPNIGPRALETLGTPLYVLFVYVGTYYTLIYKCVYMGGGDNRGFVWVGRGLLVHMFMQVRVCLLYIYMCQYVSMIYFDSLFVLAIEEFLDPPLIGTHTQARTPHTHTHTYIHRPTYTVHNMKVLLLFPNTILYEYKF